MYTKHFFEFQIPYAKGSIPQPGIILQFILNLAFGNEKLLKLECLTDFYECRGLFKYEGMIYIFDPKLAQSAINKLEKGAEEYLKNSPLKETFLMSSSRSPDIRRAIATLFRKSTLEENGGLIIKDVMNMCDKIEGEANEGTSVLDVFVSYWQCWSSNHGYLKFLPSPSRRL